MFFKYNKIYNNFQRYIENVEADPHMARKVGSLIV